MTHEADSGNGHADPTASHVGDDEVDPGWPWSFLLLVAAGALYLIFRFVEFGIELFG